MGAWNFVDRRSEKVLAGSTVRRSGRAMSAAKRRRAPRPVRPARMRREQAALVADRAGKRLMMATEIKVPTLGESVTSATVARWMKQEGEAVAADEPLVELETDKVTVEVSAPAAGVLTSISAPEGSEVPVGALLGVLDGAAVAAQAQAAPTAAPKPPPAPAPRPAAMPLAGRECAGRVARARSRVPQRRPPMLPRMRRCRRPRR